MLTMQVMACMGIIIGLFLLLGIGYVVVWLIKKRR